MRGRQHVNHTRIHQRTGERVGDDYGDAAYFLPPDVALLRWYSPRNFIPQRDKDGNPRRVLFLAMGEVRPRFGLYESHKYTRRILEVPNPHLRFFGDTAFLTVYAKVFTPRFTDEFVDQFDSSSEHFGPEQVRAWAYAPELPL